MFQKNIKKKKEKIINNEMLRTLIFFLTIFYSYSIANETNSNINFEDPYYKLGWKNFNSIENLSIKIPGSNASISIIPSEIYLDEKEKISKYEEFTMGVTSGDDAPILIINDKDDYYTIKVEYNDSGYVDIERFKNTNNSEILNTLKLKGADQIKDIIWLDEPSRLDYSINNQIISNNGLRIDWSDGDITYQYTSYILGKEGYVTLTMLLMGAGDENDDFFQFYNSVLPGISETIFFNDGFKYSDHDENNYKSIYTLSNLIDNSYGMGISTDPTVSFVYCMPTTRDLKKAGITEKDYNRFAGKEINFIISEVNGEISDISSDEEVSVLTGMYGPQDKQLFQKQGGNVIRSIKYSNTINLNGDKEGDFVKYQYDNKIIFKNEVPNTFTAKIDQTGLSFNNWNLSIKCKNEPFSDEEILSAKKITKVSPEMNELVEKLMKQRNKNNKIDTSRKQMISQKPFNYSLFVEEDGTDYFILYRIASSTKSSDLYNYIGIIVYNKTSNYVDLFYDIYVDYSKDKKTYILPVKLNNSSNDMNDYIVPEYELDDFKYKFTVRQNDYTLEFESKDGLERIENYYNNGQTFTISSYDGLGWNAAIYKSLDNFNEYKKLSKTNPRTICNIISEPLIEGIRNKELESTNIKSILKDKGIEYKTLGC